MRFLFLLFVIVPVLEMWLLITIGQQIGALFTIGLVLLTAVIGINLLRHQGFSTMARAQERMQHGQMPAQEVMEGVALAVGGALLLTPGFVTDSFGFACLIPHSRRWLIKQLSRGLMQNASVFGASTHVNTRASDNHADADVRGDTHQQPVTLDGEYSRDDDSDA